MAHHRKPPKHIPKATFNDKQLAWLDEVIQPLDDVKSLSIYRLVGTPQHALVLEVSGSETLSGFLRFVEETVLAAPDFVRNYPAGRQRLYAFQALVPDILPWLRDVQPLDAAHSIFCDVLFFPLDWHAKLEEVAGLYPPEKNSHVLGLADRESIATIKF